MAPPQPEKLAKFAITSLERNPRQELVLEPGLGIHVGLTDTSEYSVLDDSAQLAPEDLQLIEVTLQTSDVYKLVASSTFFLLGNKYMQGEHAFTPDSKGPKKVRERLRGSKAELSWLMRTTYISNESDSKRQSVSLAERKDIGGAEIEDADEAHLQAAEVRHLSVVGF